MPFAVKNLFDVAGLPTLAGSKINRDRPPATADATLIARLEAAGAVLVGALNMGEYAYDFTGENVHDGPSRNPHDTAHMTGGSSGGSGGAVAGGPGADRARLRHQRLDPRPVLLLRPVRPEADLRPAFARAHASRSWRASIIWARSRASTRDLALAYDAMQGHDPEDPVCADRPAEPALPRLERGVAGLRIAVAGGYFKRGASPEALPPSRASPRRWAPRARSRSPRPAAPAPPPSSSRPARAPRCISTACARGRAISSPPFATG